MANVVLRTAQKDDWGLIFSTWSGNAFNHAARKPPMMRREWFRLHYGYVCEVLEQGDVFIACLADDPNNILGYSVVSDGELQWVYVKPPYREMGIGKLLSGVWPVSELHLTKIGKKILDKRKEITNEKTKHSESSRGSSPENSSDASGDLRDSSDQSEVPSGSQ